MSYVRAFRPVVPSESFLAFRKYARKMVSEMAFSNKDPFAEWDVYRLDKLKVTLFERRALGKDSNDALTKLATVLSDEKLTTTKRTRTRPGVFETTTKRIPNPLISALMDMEVHYLADSTNDTGAYTFNLRASQIIDSTEDDYRKGGTELALLLDDNLGVNALMAQHSVYEDKAGGMNAARRLTSSQWHERLGGLVIPFMVAPFDSEGDRDDFITALTMHKPQLLPVHGIEVGAIDWDIRK